MTPSEELVPRAARPSSALRRSALERLGLVAIPILALWLCVALALDLFA